MARDEHRSTVHFAHTVLGTQSGLNVLYASKAIEIRRQMMRGHRRSSGLSQAQADEQPSAKDLTGRFRLDGTSRGQRSRRPHSRDRRVKKGRAPASSLPSLQVDVAAASIDPFDTLPIPIQKPQSLLLQEFSDSVFFQHPLAISTEGLGFQDIFTDAAFLNAALSMIALRQDLNRGYKVSKLALFHKGETIRIVRDRLTTRGPNVCGSTIAAVAALSAFDLMDSTVVAVPWNLNALDKMIEARGGLNSFTKHEYEVSGSQLLVKVITWLDVCFRTFKREYPPLVHAMTMSSFVSSGNDGMLSPFITATEHLLEIIKQLSAELENNASSAAIQDVFSNTLVLVENYIYEQQENNKPDPYTDLCLTAASTYINLFLRQIPINAAIYIRLTPKLRITLQATLRSITTLNEHDRLDVLLWAVFMGAITSKSALTARQNGEDNLQSQKWWIGHLQCIAAKIGLYSLQEFEDIMTKVINMTSGCRYWCKLIWKDIKTASS